MSYTVEQYNDFHRVVYSFHHAPLPLPLPLHRSFIMTTKLVAYIKNSLATLDGCFDASNPPYSLDKTKEWLTYAEGFTSGTLRGDEARSAFARATWAGAGQSNIFDPCHTFDIK